jgi:pyruvate/2-oxoglutarate/acetoin dehydrogenase E1 component
MASGCTSLARAAATLADEGIEVEIVTFARWSRWTRRRRESVLKTSRLLVLHEANKTMGFGAEVAAFAAEELFYDLDADRRGPGRRLPPAVQRRRGGGDHPDAVRRRHRNAPWSA